MKRDRVVIAVVNWLLRTFATPPWFISEPVTTLAGGKATVAYRSVP